MIVILNGNLFRNSLKFILINYLLNFELNNKEPSSGKLILQHITTEMKVYGTAIRISTKLIAIKLYIDTNMKITQSP